MGIFRRELTHHGTPPSALIPTDTHAMGRRKIDIAYLPDDRVRKVTFCKRKGGLFKKADDLSKLCGVEVAVLIVSDNKTCEYASTDVSRVLTRYQALRAGATTMDTSETQKLWTRLESQRRELESLTRQLAEERRIVDELRHTSTRPLDTASEIVPVALPMRGIAPLATAAVPSRAHFTNLPTAVSPIMARPTQLQAITAQDKADTDGESTLPTAPTFCEGEGDDASDDTAEIESHSEDTDEPASKRSRLDVIDSSAPAQINATLAFSTEATSLHPATGTGFVQS